MEQIPIKDSKIIDYIVDLGIEAVKDKVKNSFEEQQVRRRLENFLKKEKKLNWTCSLKEEIDFGGLAEYIQTSFPDDVKERLFGNRKERGVARQRIIDNAVYYAQAHTSLSKERAIFITEKAFYILRRYYKKKVNRDLKFVVAQIEDVVTDATKEQTAEIGLIVRSSEKNLENVFNEKIYRIAASSIEKNMELMKNGEIGQVEDNLANIFDAVGSVHQLSPDYRYSYDVDSKRFYSQPLTRDALEKYAPKICCTGTVQMGGSYLSRLDTDTIDYANRHQLEITLNVVAARKFLGDIEDPIQYEAQDIEGKRFVIPPKPFPPASPCSISLDGDVMFDYILFRTEKILDDGVIVISNREQDNCPYKIKMFADIRSGKMTYSVDTVNPTNEELLIYLQFLMRASKGEHISIKVLSLGEELATGKLGNVEYKVGFDKIEAEMDILEKIVTIERFYKDTIPLPEEILTEDFRKISYLSSLIRGNEFTGSWCKLDLSMTLTEELKHQLAEAGNEKFSLSYIGNITVPIYGKSFDLPVVRTFESVIYDDIEYIKKKADILKIGEIILLTFLPSEGDKGVWTDRMDN